MKTENRQETPDTQPGQEGRGGGTGVAAQEEDTEMPVQCLHSHLHTNRTLDSLNNVDPPHLAIRCGPVEASLGPLTVLGQDGPKLAQKHPQRCQMPPWWGRGGGVEVHVDVANLTVFSTLARCDMGFGACFPGREHRGFTCPKSRPTSNRTGAGSWRASSVTA